VIQKQKPQRNAEADCLEDNCEHYRANKVRKQTQEMDQLLEIVYQVIRHACLGGDIRFAEIYSLRLSNQVRRIRQNRGAL
jgi:hypothetical protein